MTDQENQIVMPDGVPFGPWKHLHFSVTDYEIITPGGERITLNYEVGEGKQYRSDLKRIHKAVAALPAISEAAMMAFDVLNFGQPKSGAEAQGLEEMRVFAVKALRSSLGQAGFLLTGGDDDH